MLADEQEGGGDGLGIVEASPVSQGKQAVFATKIRPSASPRRGLILAGAVGQFVLAGAAIVYGIAQLIIGRYDYIGRVTAFPRFLVAVIFSIALFIQLVAFLAIGRRWRSAMGYATFVYGIMAASALLAASAYLFLTTKVNCDYWGCYSELAFPLRYAGEFMVGLLLILQGSTLIASGRQLNNMGSAVTSGVLLIVGGGFIGSWALTPIGLFLVAPAAIIAGVILIMASNQGITTSG